jgi:hypothetical protein
MCGHSRRRRGCRALVACQLPQIPLVVPVGCPLEVAGVRAGDGEETEIYLAPVLRRQHGDREAAPMSRRVRLEQGLVRILGHVRQTRLHRRKQAVHSYLELVEVVLEPRRLIGWDAIRHPDIVYGDTRELAYKTDVSDRSIVADRHRDRHRSVGPVLRDRNKIPKPPA